MVSMTKGRDHSTLGGLKKKTTHRSFKNGVSFCETLFRKPFGYIANSTDCEEQSEGHLKQQIFYTMKK